MCVCVCGCDVACVRVCDCGDECSAHLHCLFTLGALVHKAASHTDFAGSLGCFGWDGLGGGVGSLLCKSNGVLKCIADALRAPTHICLYIYVYVCVGTPARVQVIS